MKDRRYFSHTKCMVAEMQEQQEYRDATKKASSWSYTNFVRGNPTGARTVETMLQYAGFFAPVSEKA